MTQSKFAVTGGIGSGKSAFMSILREMGYAVYSCDEIYRELLQDEEYLTALRARFPDCFCGEALNKRALAERVFSDEGERAALNSIAHPRVMQRLFERAREPVYFAEVPLLFEGGFEGLFDGVIVLTREDDARVRAVMERDGLTEAEVRARMKGQLADSARRCDNCVIVKNDGDLTALRERARAALQTLGVL